MILCCGVRAKARTKNVQCSYYLNVEILRSEESPCMRGENQRFLSGTRSGRRDREWGVMWGQQEHWSSQKYLCWAKTCPLTCRNIPLLHPSLALMWMSWGGDIEILRACALVPGEKRIKELEQQLIRDCILMEQGSRVPAPRHNDSGSRGFFVLVSGSQLNPFCFELEDTLLSSLSLMQELCLRNTSLQTNGPHVHHLPGLELEH